MRNLLIIFTLFLFSCQEEEISIDEFVYSYTVHSAFEDDLDYEVTLQEDKEENLAYIYVYINNEMGNKIDSIEVFKNRDVVFFAYCEYDYSVNIFIDKIR